MQANSLTRRAAIGPAAWLLLAACKRRQKIRVEQTEEEGASLASVIHMSDPKTAAQLLKGFHGIEEGAWRWTTGSFSVALRPPRGAAAKGATLHFRFALPDAVLLKLKTVSLSATVNGTNLSPETYTQTREFDYSREISPSILAGDIVNVEFHMDRFIPAGLVEERELGVIASSVGLEPK